MTEVNATYITPEMSALISQTVAEHIARIQGGGVDVPRGRVHALGQSTLWRYTANENMGASTSNECEVDLLFLDGTDTTSDVDLLDKLVIGAEIRDGDAGYCVEQGGEFFPVSVDRTFIEFKLTNALTTSEATNAASVEAYWGGPDPGATCTVQNIETDSSGVYVFEGAEDAVGLAVKRGANFMILNMECP